MRWCLCVNQHPHVSPSLWLFSLSLQIVPVDLPLDQSVLSVTQADLPEVSLPLDQSAESLLVRELNMEEEKTKEKKDDSEEEEVRHHSAPRLRCFSCVYDGPPYMCLCVPVCGFLKCPFVCNRRKKVRGQTRIRRRGAGTRGPSRCCMACR